MALLLAGALAFTPRASGGNPTPTPEWHRQGRGTGPYTDSVSNGHADTHTLPNGDPHAFTHSDPDSDFDAFTYAFPQPYAFSNGHSMPSELVSRCCRELHTPSTAPNTTQSQRSRRMLGVGHAPNRYVLR